MQQSCLGADSTSGEKKYELTQRPSATTELTHLILTQQVLHLIIGPRAQQPA